MNNAAIGTAISHLCAAIDALDRAADDKKLTAEQRAILFNATFDAQQARQRLRKLVPADR